MVPALYRVFCTLGPRDGVALHSLSLAKVAWDRAAHWNDWRVLDKVVPTLLLFSIEMSFCILAVPRRARGPREMLCSRAAPLAQRRLAPLAEGGKGFGARSAAPKAAPKRKAQNAPRLTKASPVPEGFGIACRLEQAPAENAKVRAGGELASGAGAWRQRRTRARLT